MARILIGLTLGATLVVAGCGGNGNGGGISAPPLESPLATEETSVGAGASPSVSSSANPSPSSSAGARLQDDSASAHETW
jgi:hypothetical protein